MSPTPLPRSDRLVVEDLYPGLRRFAAVVGPAEDDPDDLVQEALYQTLRRRSLHELDDPGAYLRRVIVSLSANARRSLGRRRRAFARFGADGPETGRHARASREAGALAVYPSDVADLLRLPPEARAVLWMAEVEGATYGEIAVALGCSEEAARTKAARARRRLRAELVQEM